MKRVFGYPRADGFYPMAEQERDMGKQGIPKVFYACSVGH